MEVLIKKRNDLETYRISGIGSANDDLNIDLGVTNLLFSLACIETLSGSLNDHLCFSLFIDPKTVIQISENYGHTVETMTQLQNYVDKVLAKVPELKALPFQQKAASYRIKLARGDNDHMLNVFGSVIGSA